MATKACAPCAKARRKCGKQTPHCMRCRTKGLACHYPPIRPSQFVALAERHSPLLDMFDFNTPLLVQPTTFFLEQSEPWWFASPQAWKLEAAPTSCLIHQQLFSSNSLRQLLRTIFAWLRRWVETGSNPFIHAYMYQYHMPSSIQDAYTSLSCYLHKTEANEGMVYRIIENRVVKLVAEGVRPLGSFDDASNTSARPGDALEYLARVQALVVYQCIGLYDGNVRLRYLAEQHIPVLEGWMLDLLTHNSRGVCCGESLINALSEDCAQAMDILGHRPQQYFLWYSWILAESTRRTWLIAIGMQGLYQLLRTGKTNCLGATVFTSRSGFWEATSAEVWERKCSEKWAGQVRLGELETMLGRVPRDELNEFTKVLLQCTYGAEQLQRWGIDAVAM